MVHIGTAEYYRLVQSRLCSCDEVIFEGVRSFRVHLLTSSYRWVVRRRRLGLVTQADGLKLRKLTTQLTHADLAGLEFQEGWKAIPWHFRIGLLCLAPLYGLWRYCTASRASLGKGQSLEDLPSRRDLLSDEVIPGFNAAVRDARDEKLLNAIEAASQNTGEPRIVGIVYGAAHMQAVIAHLMSKRGYTVTQSDWLTVMEYSE